MKNKILIIEDEENLVELLKVNLVAEGFEVDFALDGEEGLRMVSDNKPDLIILDVRLPQIDGWTVCRTIKNDEKTKDIPVIILTAASQKSDEQASIEAGSNFYLTKPFDPTELVDMAKTILA